MNKNRYKTTKKDLFLPDDRDFNKYMKLISGKIFRYFLT